MAGARWLGRLAELVELFHSPESSAREKLALNGEIRLARQAFGLDAASRRRLGWDVEKPAKAENAVERFLRQGPTARGG